MDLLRNSFFTVTMETRPNRTHLVRVVRTSATFSDITDVVLQHNLLIGALDRSGRKNCYLIIDLREAPGRSDPAFEEAMATIRPKMVADFRRVGLLTKTAPGTLQVSRHMDADKVTALISSSEEEIIKFFRI